MARLPTSTTRSPGDGPSWGQSPRRRLITAGSLGSGAEKIADMYPVMDIDLGDLRLRSLTENDVDLVVEATRNETGPAFWGPRPVGPYSAEDARAALRAWDHLAGGQVSYGVLNESGLVAALGLMPSAPHAAELAYWVRPEQRRRGIALRSVGAVTEWAHQQANVRRVWLEIDPVNAASLRLAERAGYKFEERLPDHCRSWVMDDPELDSWHDCLIWTHMS
jgi:RimJ/RimL family protein N-acetyltransferase